VDDIVTRLRKKYSGQLPICREAADEIERLRAEVQAWKELAQELTMYAAMQEMTGGHDGFA